MSGFERSVLSLPDQLRAAPAVEGALSAGPLIVAGMGGSAMAGDFLSLLCAPGRDVTVMRDAHLPRVAPGTSVLCVSYSGDTAETLSVWDEARAAGLSVGAVSSGGELHRRAEAARAPRARVPAGLAPRVALGHLLRAAHAVSGAPPENDRWEGAALHLSEVAGRWQSESGGAKTLVDDLVHAWPIVLSGDAAWTPAARRWIGELAENAKRPALRWEFPEAVHNEIMVLSPEAGREDLAVVALGEPLRAAERPAWEATLHDLSGRVSVHRVLVPHADPWIRCLGLAYTGDWVSLHLARRRGVDPEDISYLTELKGRRARAGRDQEAP